jgi:ABC-2 type transport system permease protein
VYEIWVIAKKDLKDLLQAKAYLYLVLVILACFPYYDGLKNILAKLAAEGSGPQDLLATSQGFVDGMAYALPFILGIFVCSIVTNYSIVMDKAKRTLEPLMATPLGVKHIWIGKTLATALPGLAIGIILFLLTLIAVNILVIQPQVGSFILPGIFPLVSALIISPILVLLVVSLISFLQLVTTKPAIASVVFPVIFLGIYFPTIIADRTAGWVYPVIYLAAIAVLVAATFAMLRLLTKERIALSSRG